MEHPLIVGVDGSEPGLRAIDWAVAEAAYHDVPLRLVHGSLWERYEYGVAPDPGTGPAPEHLTAERILEAAAERVAGIDPTVRMSVELVPADPASALLRASGTAFAVVVGTRGRGPIAGLLLGSTSLEVAARAMCPVIVVRGAAPHAADGFSRIALGVGPAGESAAACAFAFQEAEVRDAELLAVHAWQRPAPAASGRRRQAADALRERRAGHHAERVLDDALRAAAQEYPKVAVRRALPASRARDALLNASAGSDLLVVGVRRRGGVGLQLGQTAHAVLHHSACSVALVPQRH